MTSTRAHAPQRSDLEIESMPTPTAPRAVRPRAFRRALFGGAALTLAACFNIYVQFPASAISDAAHDQVREVLGEPPAAPEPARTPTESGTEETPAKSDGDAREDGSARAGFQLLPVVLAAEGDINIKIDSPAIRAITEQQAARMKKLRPHLDAGRVGIAASGDLSIRNEDGLDLKGKKELRELTDAENASRAELYKEVARANKIDPAKVEEIRKLWAQAWMNEAPAGWWIQKDGKWQQKPKK